MVVFVQERRFLQLLFKTCIALLLGWHVYSLLFPFVICGFLGELIHRNNFTAQYLWLPKNRRDSYSPSDTWCYRFAYISLSSHII